MSNVLRDRDWRSRQVLLLQGPVGPFFQRLARCLEDEGATVHRVNFNGGDWLFHQGGDVFRGRSSERLPWLRSLMLDRRIDLVALFGDHRPVHDGMHALCEELGIELMVFEEGYFRPAFITCESGGVNARSAIPRDPDFYRSAGDQPVPAELAPHRWSFWLMALWAVLYYVAAALLRPCFRHYRHHRPLRLAEGLRWLRGAARKWSCRWRERGMMARLSGPLSGRFVLVPLQVHNDAQVTHNSGFGSVTGFIDLVATSFAAHADRSQVLVFKHHPMDRAYTDYRAHLKRLERQLGLQGRLLYLHDQHLPTLLAHAAGAVVINSTVGLSALHQGVATKTLGQAFYDFEGLTHQGPLDRFWADMAQSRPDRDLYLAYRRWVIRHTQVNDNFYGGLAGPPSIGNGRWQPIPPPPSRRVTLAADTGPVPVLGALPAASEPNTP